MPDLIIITGPTAVGKSEAAIELAGKIGGEIVGADSMQVYKKMNIGTGKIPPEQRKGIVHHLIDVLEPSEEYSVGHYVLDAGKAIDSVRSRGKMPILVGGTGLYINALLNGHNFAQTPGSKEVRKKYADLAETKGNAYLYGLLRDRDPQSCGKINENDTKRVVRALEIAELSGRTKSEMQSMKKASNSYRLFVLNKDREALYQKINGRVERMFQQGLVQEVERLREYKGCQSMQAIGYKEVFGFLDGDRTLSETVELVKMNSRRYAKRQLTYFRGLDAEKIWLNDNYLSNIENILDSLE